MAAMLIMAGIAAGVSAYSAHKQSEAAKAAAKTQTEAGDKSLAFQEKQFNEQRNAFQPYRDAGVSAANRLQLGATAAAPVFRPGQSMSLADFGQPAASQPSGAPIGVPPSPAPPRMQPQPGAPSAGGPMVMMQGPDGVQKQVPAHVVPQLQQKGFRVIPGG